MPIVYWIVLALFFSITFFPGALILRAVWRDSSRAEQFAFGPFLSLPLILVLWRVTGQFGAEIWQSVFFLLALLTPALFAARWQKSALADTDATEPALTRIVLTGVAAHLVLTAAAQLFWDAPSWHGGDHLFHTYKLPVRFFIEHTLAADKPALIAMCASALTGAVGGDISTQWLYQLAVVAFNSAIIAPVILLANKLGGIRAAKWAALLVAVNPYFVQQTMYAWPKLAAAGGTLSAAYLLFFRRDVASALVAGICAAIAQACHQQAALLIVPMGAVWIFDRTQENRRARAVSVLLTGAAAYASFVAWAASHGYVSADSRQMMCPFINEWWYHQWGKPPEQIFARLAEFRAWDIFSHRAMNWLATFFPVRFLERPYYFVFDKLPAALGLLLTFAGLRAFIGAFRNRQQPNFLRTAAWLVVVWSLAMAAFAGCVVQGLAGWGLAAMLGLWMSVAAAQISQERRANIWLIAVLVEFVAWAGVWLASIQYLVKGHKELADPLHDDFMERMMRTADFLRPGDLIFADDLLAGLDRWLAVALGAMILAALVQVARSVRSPGA